MFIEKSIILKEIIIHSFLTNKLLEDRKKQIIKKYFSKSGSISKKMESKIDKFFQKNIKLSDAEFKKAMKENKSKFKKK